MKYSSSDGKEADGEGGGPHWGPRGTRGSRSSAGVQDAPVVAGRGIQGLRSSTRLVGSSVPCRGMSSNVAQILTVSTRASSFWRLCSRAHARLSLRGIADDVTGRRAGYVVNGSRRLRVPSPPDPSGLGAVGLVRWRLRGSPGLAAVLRG